MSLPLPCSKRQVMQSFNRIQYNSVWDTDNKKAAIFAAFEIPVQ